MILSLSGPIAPRRIPLGYRLHLPAIHGAIELAQLDPSLLESELYRLIRSHPQQQRERLEWDVDLQTIARRRCENMRRDQYVGHVDPDGHGPNWWVHHYGELPDWYEHDGDVNWIESIRLGPGDAADALAALLFSPRHRDHVLGEGWFGGQWRMGIGCGPTWEEPVPAQFIFCILTCH